MDYKFASKSAPHKNYLKALKQKYDGARKINDCYFDFVTLDTYESDRITSKLDSKVFYLIHTYFYNKDLARLAATFN